ncbi:hypothetical protein K7X08_011306 [Anisodus acutangulus]|uniref:Uncharacterized protein n=1 Tax=Anisodus acutangulus TaxID=402998 RepID=A0A9Q1LYG7_9SOLA|nr:hypothetical protein K7X08_011306 [Anisodus acutangulus]
MGPSNPTPHLVVVDIPARVDLLSDLSVVAQLLRNFLKPEGQMKREACDLENSLFEHASSIHQSHLIATTNMRKVKEQFF